jgi:uncharacterized protein YjiS (DUF1127 family)
MAKMITAHANTEPGLPGLSAFLSPPIATAERIFRRFRERRELNRLLSFPDYMLKDVGLQRHDIQREALRSLWRD